jgi:hypothetical protein
MGDSRSENRKEVRTLAADELISASLRPEGSEEEILGFIVDTSTNGFQISVPKEIALHTTVHLTINRQTESGSGEAENFIARVRWCKRDIIFTGFEVGLEILNFALVE